MQTTAISIDITPNEPCIMGASGVPPNQWTTIDDPLEANVMAIQQRGHHPIIIISLDCLYPGHFIREQVQDRLPKVPPENILLAGSHTHRAPMTDPTKPRLGQFAAKYTAMVATKICDAIELLLGVAPESNTLLRTGSTKAHHSVNRRSRRAVQFIGRFPRFNSVAIAPNPSGPSDEILTVALFVSGDEPVALIWNYACHPVAYPTQTGVSSHFPGVVRSKIRRELDAPSLPVIFLQGFSGDTRPSASSVPPKHRIWGAFAQRSRFENMSLGVYADWSESLGSKCLEAVNGTLTATELSEIVCKRLSLPGNHFADRLEHNVTFQSIAFGEALAIAAISAEPVAEYASTVRELSPTVDTMCVGCVDHTYGYLPTNAMVREGGYEGGTFTPEFGIGRLTANIEDVALKAISQLF